MQYWLSKLTDINILQPDDTVVLDYSKEEQGIEYLKVKMLICNRMLFWFGCETVELSNDRPGEKQTHYHMLYFKPKTSYGESPLLKFIK